MISKVKFRNAIMEKKKVRMKMGNKHAASVFLIFILRNHFFCFSSLLTFLISILIL